MKAIKLLPFISLMIATASAQTPSAQDVYVGEKVTAFMQQHHIPGMAVEMVVNGKPKDYYFGYQDEAKSSPVIAKTIFEIGSISKIMTSLLIAQEVDWAKMQFNDPITKYVPDLPKNWEKIRLQDLATHTAGLPFMPTESLHAKTDLTNYVNTKLSNAKAGQDWRYSNIGVSLLGAALENSTESDFGDLYRRHILNPLQMVNGASIPAAYEKYYAQGYNAQGKPVPHEQAEAMLSAYGLKASALDMKNFLRAAIGLEGTTARVFYPMRMTQSIYVHVGDDYQGLGWMIHKLEDGQRRLLQGQDYQGKGPLAIRDTYGRALFNNNTLIDKNGMTDGFAAYIAVLPSKQSGIVILANKQVKDKQIAILAREILFHLST